MSSNQAEKKLDPANNSSVLKRALSLPSAIAIGLGSMIGAGVFVVFAPASLASGSGLLIALLIAALVAFANATSSAQLAAVYPQAGGSYLYGRKVLGPWWGFAAGWSFIIGKTASSAAMAMTFAYYAAPPQWQKPVAIAAVLTLGAVNYFGVTRTATLAVVIVSISITVILLAVSAGFFGATAESNHLVELAPQQLLESLGSWESWFGILQAVGLLFFAFAGYARIATMGEEVKNPAKTIPRAIISSLSLTVVLYFLVAVALVAGLGFEKLGTSAAPLAELVRVAGWDWLLPIISLGAAAASLGALLALLTGIGRTSLAMAREGDLPVWLAKTHPKYQVPHRAELVLLVFIVILLLVSDLRGAIGFSSFGVLIYYFVANLAAYNQPQSERRYPRFLAAFGLASCAVLPFLLPLESVIGGVIVLSTGLLLRLLLRKPKGKGL